jgi:CheY-like chemotaxis protein
MIKECNILLVDDDEMCNFINSMLIKRVGIAGNTTIANNGQDALKYLQDKPFDIVLLDVHMPNMNGFDVLDVLTKRQESTGISSPPIFMLTSSISCSDKLKAGTYSIVRGFISKPLTEETMQGIVDFIEGTPNEG